MSDGPCVGWGTPSDFLNEVTTHSSSEGGRALGGSGGREGA